MSQASQSSSFLRRPFGAALVSTAVMGALLAVSSPDAEFTQKLADLGVDGALGVAVQTAIPLAVTFVAILVGMTVALPFRGKPNRQLIRAVIYGASGLPVGFFLAMTHEAFGRVPALLGAPAVTASERFGAFEMITILFALMLIAIGAFALLGAMNAQSARALGLPTSGPDRRAGRPAGAAVLVEGVNLVLLTFAFNMDWSTLSTAHYALLGLIPALVFADLLLLRVCWRSGDELFRSAWLEGMGATFAIALPLGILYALLQTVGVVPAASIYHVIVAAYIGYIVVGTMVTVRRMPGAFKGGECEEGLA
jgi:hypothetical protein